MAGGEPLIRSLGHAGWRLGEHALGETSCEEAVSRLLSSKPLDELSTMQSSIFCRHPEQTTIQGGGPFRFERCQCSAATIAAAHALDAEIFETFLAFLAPYHSDFDQISRFCADCSRLMNQERRRDGFRSFESVIFLLIFFFLVLFSLPG